MWSPPSVPQHDGTTHGRRPHNRILCGRLVCAVVRSAFSITARKLGFALCCHSHATRAPIANPPNNAQLGDSLYHAKLHPGPCSSVGVRPRTHRQKQTRVTTIHFASSMTHAKCNELHGHAPICADYFTEMSSCVVCSCNVRMATARTGV